jgi:glycosyltransferase involved in cell wall biosynthesis
VGQLRAIVVTVVHFLVPDGVLDPLDPSGGNVYDRVLSAGLARSGWNVHEHAVAGDWPDADSAAQCGLLNELARFDDDELVLVDGLIASAAAAVMSVHARRLRLVVLIHMPLGAAFAHPVADGTLHAMHAGEAAALHAAAQVITTSAWTRDRVLDWYRLPPERVHVAVPGTDEAALVAGTETGRQLLCIATVSALKGHDLLLRSLASISQLPWQCSCVGSTDRDPRFVDELRTMTQAHELEERFVMRGTRVGSALEETYAAADVLIVASRVETYGMVIGEALARGLPVIAADVGGVGEAIGVTSAGTRPGLLVPPQDPVALTTALSAWLTDESLRRSLREAAADRRQTLPRWSDTIRVVTEVLTGAMR